ncbi:alpha-amylase family glycosyl hydrolase [Methanosarcina siciliae]|nr:alpha-amylase family glycosyl hydrolase [Methanosarcina siciliae]
MSSEMSKQLEKDLKSSLENFYGMSKADVMFANILEIIKKTRSSRPASLASNDVIRDSSWYKDEIVYMFYADQFGVKDRNTTNTFKCLIEMLPYLKDLGVTTVYIMPFMDSPMGDGGFDVKDPQNVRANLGGIDEFNQFMVQAREYGLKIQADLVLNHFSDQHKWFQGALNGDVSKLDYFIFCKELPAYSKRDDPQRGKVVDYTEDNGKVSSRRLMFPNTCEKHYRKINLHGMDYYLYHTFYPFQLDINWENPEVLYYVLETIAFWNNAGIDIFRLDAIPFFIKEKGTNAENLPKNHEIVKIISSFIQAIGPRSILLAEACQYPKDILPYFGKERTFNIHESKKLTRTDEVQVAYNFPYMTAIWASLVTENNEHFWNAYEETPAIPNSATWTQFLRVHDELTLEMVDIRTRKIIYDAFVSKGAQFREGLGVCGRMANFLDNNPEKISLAFAILLSLPGIPVIYYGDEIGAQNDLKYGKEAANKREKILKEIDPDLKINSFDSRDINRGPILREEFYNSMKDGENLGNLIYKAVKNLIKVRKDTPVLRRGKLSRIESGKEEIFSYLMDSGDQQLIVVNNLSGEISEAKLTLSSDLAENIGKTEDMTNILNGEKIKACLEYKELIISLRPYQALWLSYSKICF